MEQPGDQTGHGKHLEGICNQKGRCQNPQKFVFSSILTVTYSQLISIAGLRLQIHYIFIGKHIQYVHIYINTMHILNDYIANNIKSRMIVSLNFVEWSFSNIEIGQVGTEHVESHKESPLVHFEGSRYD